MKRAWMCLIALWVAVPLGILPLCPDPVTAQTLQEAVKIGLNIPLKAAEPDALVMVLFGQDKVAALSQTQAMGLKKKIKIIVPLIELHMAHSVGPEGMAGVIATTSWYWELEDRFDGSRTFVEAFRNKYAKPPGIGAAAAWVAINEWAKAVQRAKDFASRAVIPALEDHTFIQLKDAEKRQSWDHQAMTSVYIVERTFSTFFNS